MSPKKILKVIGQEENLFDINDIDNLISSINFDKNKLNVFCAYDGLEFSSVASAEVLVEGQVIKCMLSRLKAKFSDGMFRPKSAWQYYEVLSVSSSNEDIPEEWFTDSVEDEAMEWFFKNISQKYRNFKKLDSLITKWANRT